MCGLVAIQTNYRQVASAMLMDAINVLQHRGPDMKDCWIAEDSSIGMAHARLNIIDLMGGKQPLFSQDNNLVAIVNGEFYDYERIRSSLQLEGYSFSSESDSEILLALYQKYGIGCLNYLRGEFAFVLWDKARRRLFAARDRFGIKPLYYAFQNNEIYLASECKAIFKLGVKAGWSSEAVYRNDHLFLMTQEDTFFEGVKQLKPGHYLVSENNNTVIRTYWDLNFPKISEQRIFDEQDCANEVLNALTESIKLRLKADVPVAAYLSGGIDSSLIVGLASTQTKLSAFTIQFLDEKFDESFLAKKTALFNDISIHCLKVDENQIADNFNETIWHSESTTFNAHSVAKFLLSRLVRDNGYKVVLTGEGADEIFGGYSFFVRDMVLNSSLTDSEMKKNLDYLNESNKVYGSLFNKNLATTFVSPNYSMKHVPVFLQNALLFGEKMKELYSSEFTDLTQNNDPMAGFMLPVNLTKLKDRHPLHQTMYLWMKSHFPSYILNLVGDRMEMAHSIEGRVPFLDHVLVDSVSQLPPDFKIRGTCEKYILKKLAQPYITSEVFERQKQPFVAPPLCFIKNSKMGQLAHDYIYGSELKKLPFYDQKRVIKYFEDSKRAAIEEQQNNEKIIFLILSMCVLQNKFSL